MTPTSPSPLPAAGSCCSATPAAASSRRCRRGRLIGGNLAIGGFSISGLWAHAPHRASAGLRRVLDLIADGRLNIAVTEVSSLAETPAAQQLLAEGRGHGKYVTRVNG